MSYNSHFHVISYGHNHTFVFYVPARE